MELITCLELFSGFTPLTVCIGFFQTELKNTIFSREGRVAGKLLAREESKP
jgi:hypothetical protein